MILMIKTKLALSVGGAAAGNALQGNEARPGPVRGTLADTVAQLHICTLHTTHCILGYNYALQGNEARPGQPSLHTVQGTK